MSSNGNTNLARRVTLLTGGFDRPYAYGLTMALARYGVAVEVIGSNGLDGPEMRSTPGVDFYLYQTMPGPDWPLWRKLASVAAYYVRLARHLAVSPARIVHVLWNNKLVHFDRTVMMAALRLAGKWSVLTAHNVNTKKRDGKDSWWNRFTLRCQYSLTDCIFVHSEKAAQELQHDFGVPPQRTRVIPFGINNSLPPKGLDSPTARRTLRLREEDKVILFFGGIRPYKGLHFLIDAFEILTANAPSSFRLIVAGEVKKEATEYWKRLSERIARSPAASRISLRPEFIPDAETECYFMAADVFALPYTFVYQSGVLFLGYNYGLPVVATRVGTLEDEVIAGETGYVCEPESAESLATTLRKYFASDLYRELPRRRQHIRSYALEAYSWDRVAQQTVAVYADLMKRQGTPGRPASR